MTAVHRRACKHIQTHPAAHNTRLSAVQPKQDEASSELSTHTCRRAACLYLVFVFLRYTTLYSRQGDRFKVYKWHKFHISPRLHRLSLTKIQLHCVFYLCRTFKIRGWPKVLYRQDKQMQNIKKKKHAKSFSAEENYSACRSVKYCGTC